MPVPTPLLIQKLEELREAVGSPVKVTSGVRCEAANAAAGGVPDSAHLIGMAADLEVENSNQRFLLLRAAMRHFKRVGIGRLFLHVDVDSSKAEWVSWVYGDR